MADKELGFVKPSASNLKEQLARKTLKNVRLQGHTYVDLREDGKRFIFFCTLCLAPCYSEDVLLQHLKGNLHKQRYAAAKATLIGENPWPFDDGVLFFHNNSDEEEKDAPSQGCEKNKLLSDRENVSNLAIVIHSDVSKSAVDGHTNGNGNGDSGDDCLGDDFQSHDVDFANELVIPGVIGKEEVSDLNVRMMGYGLISARILEKDGVHTGIQRLWCEWLGKRSGESDKIHSILPSHDFAVVTFVYYYDLGRQGLFDEIKTLLLGGEDSSNDGGSTKRRKNSISNSEDVNTALSHQCYSSGEDSGSSSTTSSALLLHRYDDDILQSRIISNKTLRRQLRKQRRTASEKMCDICQHKMLPGKDVATLLNLTTGRFACSSRNVHGAFHVFHTSCLIHWILLCEHETFMKQSVLPKVRRRSKRTKSKVNQVETECKADDVVKRKQTRKVSEERASSDQINSVFCPDCQGTGLHIEGDKLEQPTVPLSEMFKYKIKVSDAHRAWMKDPEVLENCSTGFVFPIQIDNTQGKVANLKLLQFYRADEESWCQSS